MGVKLVPFHFLATPFLAETYRFLRNSDGMHSQDGKVSASKSSDCGSTGNSILFVSTKRGWVMCLTSPQEIMHLWVQTRTQKKKCFRCLCICLVPWTWELTTSSAMTSAWTPLSRVLAGNGTNPACPSTSGNSYCESYWFKKLYCNLYSASHLCKYKKLKWLTSNQLSEIENSNTTSTDPMVFSTGNTHKNYMYKMVVTWLFT